MPQERRRSTRKPISAETSSSFEREIERESSPSTRIAKRQVRQKERLKKKRNIEFIAFKLHNLKWPISTLDKKLYGYGPEWPILFTRIILMKRFFIYLNRLDLRKMSYRVLMRANYFFKCKYIEYTHREISTYCVKWIFYLYIHEDYWRFKTRYKDFPSVKKIAGPLQLDHLYCTTTQL